MQNLNPGGTRAHHRASDGSRVHMTADSALPGPGRTTIEHTLMMPVASVRATLSSDPDGTLTTELGHAKTRREVIVSLLLLDSSPPFRAFRGLPLAPGPPT